MRAPSDELSDTHRGRESFGGKQALEVPARTLQSPGQQVHVDEAILHNFRRVGWFGFLILHRVLPVLLMTARRRTCDHWG